MVQDCLAYTCHIQVCNTSFFLLWCWCVRDDRKTLIFDTFLQVAKRCHWQPVETDTIKALFISLPRFVHHNYLLIVSLMHELWRRICLVVRYWYLCILLRRCWPLLLWLNRFLLIRLRAYRTIGTIV